MTDDPWGAGTPPAVDEVPPMPPRWADLAVLVARGGTFQPPPGWRMPTERDLPEVEALTEQGWHCIGEMPETWLLPAVWPPGHRCWVPDRRPRVMLAMTQESSWVEPLPAHRLAQMRAYVSESAAEAGLPSPPTGRLWLLRSPWPSLSTEMVFAVLRQWRDDRQLWERSDSLVLAAREVLAWSEEQVWGAWRGPQAEAARAWRERGRPAHEVTGLALACLGPEETRLLTAPIQVGGAGLTEAQAVGWTQAVMRPTPGEAVEAVIAWRSLGLPAEPPQLTLSSLDEMDPHDVAKWLADGFTFEEVSQLHGLADRDVARRWRALGCAAERARALLLADRSLTPDEAAAFDRSRISAEAAVHWVAAGFLAEEARRWTDVDVLPNEARVWRSVGRGPEEARRQRAVGGGSLPDGVEVGWSSFGEGRECYNYGVTDPPGTRGSIAEEHQQMIDLFDEG